MASVIYKNPPKSKKELKREEEIRQGQANIARMGAETTQEANREAEAFKRLAEQRLGNESQFLQSERAQEELLRRRAGGEAIAAQRQMAGSLASQGIRGGAAQAARAAQANQGAQMQSDIARQMIQGRGERQQGLRQQLLAAELSGKQFGLAKGQTTAGMKIADEAAKRGQFAQEGTYLCSLAYANGDLSEEVLALDHEYGYEIVNPYTRFGYDAWAPKLREVAANNPAVYSVIKPFVVAWADHISNVRPNAFGAVLKAIGEPVCFVIGFIRARARGIK